MSVSLSTQQLLAAAKRAQVAPAEAHAHGKPAERSLTAEEEAELQDYLPRTFPAAAAQPLPLSLQQYALKRDASAAVQSPLPAGGFVVPDFVSVEEEHQLLSLVGDSPAASWTELKNRSLQMWGGFPPADADKEFIPTRLPAWQSQLIDRMREQQILPASSAAPNHVLLNRYSAGQGILAHQDGPLYEPRVAILSLGSHTVMHFYRRLSDSLPGEQHRPAFSVFLPARSLLIFSQELYTALFHAIEERTEDVLDSSVLNVPAELRGQTLQRQTRVSLTIRRVHTLEERREAQRLRDEAASSNSSSDAPASPSSSRTVPVIDVSALLNPSSDAEARQRVAREIFTACTTWGFFYVREHGIPESLQAELESLSREFFALPLERKMRLSMDRGGLAWRGYFPCFGELTSGKADIKEGLYLGTELPEDHPLVAARVPMHGKNLFPDEDLPQLRHVCLEYLERVTQLAHVIMEGVALGLGLDAQYFNQHYTRDPTVLFRLFNYPEHASHARDENSWGVGCHTDYSDGANCFPLSTQVWTTEGFMDFHSLMARVLDRERPLLLVACYDVERETFVRAPITRDDIVTHTTGQRQLITFQGGPRIGEKMARLQVTSEHTMYVRLGYKQKTVDWEPAFERMTAITLHRWLQAGANRRAELCTYAPEGMEVDPNAKKHHSERVWKQLHLETEDERNAFLELYGYWLGDGTFETRSPAVKFSPLKPQDMEWLEHRLFNVLKLRLRGKGYGQGEGAVSMFDAADKRRVYLIRAPGWVEFFADEYGHAYKGLEHLGRKKDAPKGPGPGTMAQLLAQRTPGRNPARLLVISRTTANHYDSTMPREVPVASPEQKAAEQNLAKVSKGDSIGERKRREAAELEVAIQKKESERKAAKEAALRSKPILVDSDDEDDFDPSFVPVKTEQEKQSERLTAEIAALRRQLNAAKQEVAAALKEAAEEAKKQVKKEEKRQVKKEPVGSPQPSPPDAEKTIRQSGENIGDEVDLKSAKWLMPWVLRQGVLTAAQMRFILKGLVQADGAMRDSSDTHGVVYTSSLRFRDEVMTMALYAGFNANATIKTKAGNRVLMPSGKWAVTSQDTWTVYYSQPRVGDVITVKHGESKLENVREPVWCITVPHRDHLIVARAADVVQKDTITPGMPIVTGNSQWGVGPHCDYGCLTILKQDASGGLQVQHPSLGWIEAPPLPGTFVCNIGDMLERLTGGRFQSTPHRVRNLAPHDRLSFPVFFDPAWNAVVRPLPLDHLPPAVVSDDRARRWDRSSVHTFEGTYGQYLLKKVGNVFPDLAEKEKIAEVAAAGGVPKA